MPNKSDKNTAAFSNLKRKCDLRCMGCAFLWGLWLYITFPFKREEENDIRNGSVWKLLRCDTSMLYSLLTLNTPATHTDICAGSHRAAGALLEHLQVGGSILT